MNRISSPDSKPTTIVLWMGREADEVIRNLKERQIEFIAIPVSDLHESEIIYGLHRIRGIENTRQFLENLWKDK